MRIDLLAPFHRAKARESKDLRMDSSLLALDTWEFAAGSVRTPLVLRRGVISQADVYIRGAREARQTCSLMLGHFLLGDR